MKLPDNYYKRLSVVSCYRRNNWQGSPFWAQPNGGAYDQIWNGFPYRPIKLASLQETNRYFDVFWDRKQARINHSNLRVAWRMR